MNTDEQKIAFLTAAITDTQETIRFIDTKVAAVITLLGAFIIAFFAAVDKIVKFFWGFHCYFWFSIIIFVLLLIVCIWVTYKIIRPTHNPLNNLNLASAPVPESFFFIAPNQYGSSFYPFINSEKFQLQKDFSSFKNEFSNATLSTLIDTLIVELLKVSYIRNVKHDRFNTLLLFLIITAIAFGVSYWLFSIEVHRLTNSGS